MNYGDEVYLILRPPISDLFSSDRRRQNVRQALRSAPDACKILTRNSRPHVTELEVGCRPQRGEHELPSIRPVHFAAVNNYHTPNRFLYSFLRRKIHLSNLKYSGFVRAAEFS